MSLTPRGVYDLFAQWATRKLAAGTCRNYQRLLERWLSSLPSIDVDQLRAWHLITWADTWHELQAVKRVFHWAHEEAELLTRDPFKAVKLPPLGGRRRTITRGELVCLLRGSRRDFRLYLLGLWHTLARPQELRAITWEQLRWEGYPVGAIKALAAGNAWFELPEFKGRARRTDQAVIRIIPVPAALGRILGAAHSSAQVRRGVVLRSADGVAWTKEACRLRMQRLRQRVHLAGDNVGEPVVCYTLRHSGATEAAALGIRDRRLAELMGHASTRTTARYQHLQPADLLAAARELAAARRKRRTGSLRTHDLGSQ
jgi:integrase